MGNEMNPEFAALLEKANAGDIAAMIKVGNALRNGNKRMAVKKDFPKGVEWLKKAADQDSLEAMRSLESGYRRAADADSYDYHGYSKDADYWSQRIRDITASQMTSTEIVLIGKGKIWGFPVFGAVAARAMTFLARDTARRRSRMHRRAKLEGNIRRSRTRRARKRVRDTPYRTRSGLILRG